MRVQVEKPYYLRHIGPGVKDQHELIMRVLEVREPFGIESLAWATRPDPSPGPRDVVIRLGALSLNYRDRLVIDGVGRWRAAGPRIPVSDGVGVVVAAGRAVTRFAVGDRIAPVFYPKWIDGPPAAEKMEGALGGAAADGLYAEYAVVEETAAVRVPDHLSDQEAATLPCAGVTAWNGIAEGHPPRDGETVVILGTGGVALFALQFAKLFGARAIITSSSDAKLTRARELGADAGINYRTTPDWPRAVRELTDGRGADLVADTAGTLPEAIDAVRVGGTVAFIGLLRMRADVDLVRLMGSSATIRAIDVGSRAMFESMNRAIERAKLRPVIDRTFAFGEARDAFRYLAEGGHFGKVCAGV
jgi:NADPH:quinone reductase-like Zn-dependent oxidoreductase